jgi:hypothetical protein
MSAFGGKANIPLSPWCFDPYYFSAGEHEKTRVHHVVSDAAHVTP